MLSFVSKRWKTASAGVLTSALFSVAALTGTTTAAHAAGWQTFGGLDSKWHCGSSETDSRYVAYNCTIVSGLYFQSATVIRTKTAQYFNGEAKVVKDGIFEDSALCEGTLPSGVYRVCFSQTLKGSAGDYVQGAGDVFYGDHIWGQTVRL